MCQPSSSTRSGKINPNQETHITLLQLDELVEKAKDYALMHGKWECLTKRPDVLIAIIDDIVGTGIKTWTKANTKTNIVLLQESV